MKRILNKTITSLLILMLLLVSCPMTIIKCNAEEVEKVEYENIATYIAGNEWAYYGNAETGYVLEVENAIIKDFSDISNYSNLKSINMYGVNLGKVDNVQIPVNIKRIIIQGGFEGTLDLTDNINLEDIYIRETEENGFENAVIDIRGLKNIYAFDFSYLGTTKKYILNEKVLMDNYSIGQENEYTWEDDVNCYEFGFHIYDNLSDYFEKELSYYESKTDVTEIHMYQNGISIKDISDISEFSNLEKFYAWDLNGLEEGTYSFSNNKKLKELHICFAEQDFSNIVIDIRNMDWLKEFAIDSNFINSGFDLNKNLLIDDKDILYGYVGGTGFYYYYTIFDTVNDYLEYYGETKEEITDFYVSGKGNIIKDLSGLKELTNLKYLRIEDMDLQDVSFIEELTSLEELYIENCTLNTTLDLTNISNLNEVSISLKGDLSNSCIDITGLENLEDFWYVYEIENASNFDLSTCIKTDLILQHYESDGTYETYFWSNSGEYYLDYNKIEDYETEEGIELLFGFNLNNGKITAEEIINGGYFLEGIEAKVYSANDELLTGDDIVGSGCKVKMFVNDEVKKEYNIVIFGDTTGDGVIGASDALAIIKNKNKKLLINNPVLEVAGSVTHNSYIEDTPSAVEALAIIKYLNGKYNIEQYLGWYGMRRSRLI